MKPLPPPPAPRSLPADGRPLILLCNDDGFFREEIRILHRRLRSLGRTVIVAPDRERSAASLAVTLRQPLRLQRHTPSIWSVDGTPADCLYFALRKILPRRPDLLISGMNPGPNLGQQDVHYSGTVAAAVQALFLGLPAIAVSMIPDARGRFHLGFAASVVREIAGRILADGLPTGLALNINIPAPPVRGIKITKLGWKYYDPEIIEKCDPRGNAYYWIGTGHPSHIGDRDSDVKAVDAGWISITPIHTDVTAHETRRSRRIRTLARPL
ncbi:MAG: 5'/3'-nucleotidase SurE [Candidatus Aminicenantes bacterium]|nr:5'/3'-nucleotidase SurE [Candidatus Aminicenantes bacterium]